MNFFKKLIQKITTPAEEESVKTTDLGNDGLTVDEMFTRNFISRGGKFLYCTSDEEVKLNLVEILKENQWNNVVCFDPKLNKLLSEINSAKTKRIISSLPFLTSCESLVSEDGSIMFSSVQLQEKKLKEFPENFIVLARTSQLVRSISEGVMGVRKRAKKNSPTIVSSIKDYLPNKQNTDFMSYGNNNAKTLYLLLLEDL
jgi:L-lactate utilization protein LutC